LKIAELFKKKSPISFEIFPPKGELSVGALRGTLDAFKALSPDFISVTFSAGGTGDSNNTAELAGIIKNEYGIETMAHMTCAHSRAEDIESVIARLREKKIENILALRGDIIKGREPTEFKYAKDLIDFLSGRDFCVGAACYPEGHVDCDSLEDDIRYMRQKQDAGAEFFISQLFFDNESFYRFLERAQKAGITKPIVPGIMPMLGKTQIERMIYMCGASMPSAIVKILHRHEGDAGGLRAAGIEYAAGQVRDLLRGQDSGVHIYTMNQPDTAKSILEIAAQ
jgi:methylenetetrahydrofolate reductase (NADPH)